MGKAWAIHCTEIDACEGNGGIVFARNKTRAIKVFQEKFPYYCVEPEDVEYLVVKREPSLDQYKEEKNIPNKAYEEIGWVEG